MSDDFFFFQAEDGIRDVAVTGVQTCALPIYCGVRVVRRFARDRLWRCHSEARRGGLLGMTRSDRFATSAKCCDRLPASNRARVFLRLGGAIYSNDYLIPKNSLDTKMRSC